jgi:AcrR family transcriptional regulator
LYNDADYIATLNIGSHCITIGGLINELRRPGRPRDPRVDEALLECGLAVILESGYHGATVTEIARRAGVGTPAIYRRWPTKVEFAMELMARVSEQEPIPDTGSIRDDLVSFIALRLRTWSAPFFRQLVFPALLEGQGEGTLATQMRERFIVYRQALGARISRSVESGELRSDTNPDRLIDLLMGTITMPMLFFRDVPTVEDAQSIVDQVLSGYSAHVE